MIIWFGIFDEHSIAFLNESSIPVEINYQLAMRSTASGSSLEACQRTPVPAKEFGRRVLAVHFNIPELKTSWLLAHPPQDFCPRWIPPQGQVPWHPPRQSVKTLCLPSSRSDQRSTGASGAGFSAEFTVEEQGSLLTERSRISIIWRSIPVIG